MFWDSRLLCKLCNMNGSNPTKL
uniref:Uncharacterized protein n=1 Tax=Rhizophora mucronata TaxID=61149 RepID=A0A2P2IMD4_RHIMU